MIQLAPTMVEALGVYSVAAAVAMVSMAAGAILSQLPSRKMKGEGRSLMRAAFIGVFLISSIMAADFLISYATRLAGMPDWPSLLARARAFHDSGMLTLEVTGAFAMVFGMALAVLDILLRFTLIGTLIAHLVFAIAFSVLLVFAVIGIFLALGGAMLMLAAGIAGYAYIFVAAGVAMVSLKYLRPLAISLVVFGLALYYGVPLVLGYSHPVAVAPLDDEARAAVVLSLTNASVPARLVVSTHDGDIPLFFGYAKMNSTVTVRDVPLNSTLIANITGSRRPGRGDVSYNFTYGRFHNETYEIRAVVLGPGQQPRAIITPHETWSQLYRNTSVIYIWYRGLLLPGPSAEEQRSIRRTLDQSPTLLTPITNPGEGTDPLSAMASGLKMLVDALRGKTETDYFRLVFERGPLITIRAPTSRPLNYNVTSMVLYDEEKYRTWTELGRQHPYGNPYQVERVYRHNYTVPRRSYECWLERTEERYDPVTNTTYTVPIYKARAVYTYGSLEPLSIARYNETPVEVVSLGAWDDFGYLRFWRPSTNGSGEPPSSDSYVTYRLDEGSATYPLGKQLILGTAPLILKMNVEANRTAEWPRTLGEMADQVRGNVGRQEGYERVIEEPNQTVVLHPDGPGFLELRVIHVRQVEREEEYRCPSMPLRLNGTARVTLTSPNAPAWDPYAAGAFNWTEYSRAASYSLLDDGPVPTLSGPQPMDPRALHNMYEEDPRDAHSRSSGVSARGLMPGLTGSALELLKSIIGITIVVVGADAVSGLVGGASLSSAFVQTFSASTVASALSRLRPLAFFGGNPILKRVEDAPSRAWRSLEKNLLRHARDQIEQRKMRAFASGDRATLRRVAAFQESYRRYVGISRLQPLARLWKATPPGWIDVALSRVRGGRYSLVGRYDAALSQARDQLSRRISALLPEEGARLGHVWSLSGGKWVFRGEAREALRSLKERHGWKGVVASLALSDGRKAVLTSLTGLPTKISRSFLAFGLDAPMAKRRVGIEHLEVRGRRIPYLSTDRASLIGTTVSEAAASKRVLGGEGGSSATSPQQGAPAPSPTPPDVFEARAGAEPPSGAASASSSEPRGSSLGEVAGLRPHTLEADYRDGYVIRREDGTEIRLSEDLRVGRRSLSDYVPEPADRGERETYWRIESAGFERRDSWDGLWGERRGEKKR
jgi:hypothetical protein